MEHEPWEPLTPPTFLEKVLEDPKEGQRKVSTLGFVHENPWHFQYDMQYIRDDGYTRMDIIKRRLVADEAELWRICRESAKGMFGPDYTGAVKIIIVKHVIVSVELKEPDVNTTENTQDQPQGSPESHQSV